MIYIIQQLGIRLPYFILKCKMCRKYATVLLWKCTRSFRKMDTNGSGIVAIPFGVFHCLVSRVFMRFWGADRRPGPLPKGYSFAAGCGQRAGKSKAKREAHRRGPAAKAANGTREGAASESVKPSASSWEKS